MSTHHFHQVTMTIRDLAGSFSTSTLRNLPETHLYIAIGVVLLIGAMIPILIYCIIQKCCRCGNRSKLHQNSSLRNGLTNGDENHLTAINSNSLQMDLFSNKDNEYEEFQTTSNIYEVPSCSTTSSPKNRFIPTPQLSSTLKFSKPTNFTGTSNLQNEYSECEENSLSKTDKNSSLKKAVTKKFQRLPAIPHSASPTNSLAGTDYELDSESNIYEVPLYDEKPQQCENSLLDDEGYLIPTPMSFDNRQHIDNDGKIKVPHQWAPGYYKCYAKRNNSFLYNACNLKPNENYINLSKKTGSQSRNSGNFWKIL